MAKVKIQGNASGTGVLTVTAPNTSTDRTITLPDSTGTLATTADVPAGISSSADATAMTITSDEKIGIGTASPSEPLHVAGSGNSTKIRIQNTKSGTTTGAELEMVSEDGTWQLGQGRGSLHDGDDEDFHIYNTGTKLWIKKTNGNVYIPSGNLVIGTNGKGIDFSANADSSATGASTTSELLNDYEEGTWTPIMRGSAGSVGSAANNGGMGSYVKVGNLVHVTFSQYMTNLGSWSGDLEVGGLPFTCSHVSSGSITSFPSTEVDANMRGLGVPANLTMFHFFKGSRLDVRVPWSEIVTSYYMTVAATYRV